MFPIKTNGTQFETVLERQRGLVDFRKTFSMLCVYVVRRDIVIDTIYIVSFDSSGANV